MHRCRCVSVGWIRVGLLVGLLWTSGAVPMAAYEDQIRNEARYLVGQIAERGMASVAVIDFTDLDGVVTHLGRFMAEEMSVALATEGRSFRVVDRTHIHSLLKEHKLSSSGLVDPSTARQLGKIAGVDALITGTITPLGDSVRLSTKVLDTNSAQVVASAGFNVAKTQAVDSLLRQGVAVGGSGVPGGPVSAGSRVSTQVEREGILFTLQGCQRSNETVQCRLLLENQAQDQTLYFRKSTTRIFDHSGNETYTNRLSLGSSVDKRQVSKKLVRNVPITAMATFEGVGYEVRRLALVEFDFHQFTVQFKDVSVSQ